eukprot:7144589-Alexandrium_andersonii.AAC.1
MAQNTQMQSQIAELRNSSDERMNSLEANVADLEMSGVGEERPPPRRRGDGQRSSSSTQKGLIDTRVLGEPDFFSGEDKRFMEFRF